MVGEKEDMKLAGVREEDADDWGKMEAHDWLRPLQTGPAKWKTGRRLLLWPWFYIMKSPCLRCLHFEKKTPKLKLCHSALC